MNENGFLAIDRSVFSHPIINKDSDHLAIFIYMCGQAAHTEHDVLFNGKKIRIKRGQLITGRNSIASKLKCSESKTKRVISCFKSDQLIDQQTGNRSSLITILYGIKYLTSDQQSDQQVTSKWTASDQQVTTTEQRNKETKKHILSINIDNIEGLDENFKPIIEEWILYKNEIKNGYKSQRGINAFYKKLFELSNGCHINAKQIIDQSISNNWKGIFELKNQNNGNRQIQTISVPTNGNYRTTI